MITISRTNDRVRITGTSSSANLSGKGELDIGFPVNQFHHHRRGNLLVIRTDSALYETKDLQQTDNFRGWLDIPLTDIAGTTGTAINRYNQVLDILDFPPDPNVQTNDPIIGSGSDANRVRLQPGDEDDYLQTQGGVADWFPLTVNVGRGLQGNGRAGSPVQFPAANNNEVLAWDAGTSTYRPEVRPLYLELTNPGAAIVAGDIGKFAMPHQSTAGAAELYVWEDIDAQAAKTDGVSINNALAQVQASTTFELSANPGEFAEFGRVDGSVVSPVVAVNSVSDADTEVLIGATILATIQNLQTQLDSPTSNGHDYEIVNVVDTSVGEDGSSVSFDVRARAGEAFDGSIGNSALITAFGLVVGQFLEGGQDAAYLTLYDDMGGTDHTITVGDEAAEGADDAETATNIADWITANTAYTATAEGDQLTITYKVVGDVGNNAQVVYTDSSGNSYDTGYGDGWDAYSAPTAPVLGKIVEVTDTKVKIDTISARGYCTAVGAVNARTILVAADGGAGVVDAFQQNLPDNEEAAPMSMGTALNAAANGEQVFVAYGDPLALLLFS